jgi:flagellar hook-length control protein FliK
MENAVNIMTMVQSNSVVKKKFDVPSKTFGDDKTNFRKELNQARKEISKDSSIDTKDVGAKPQSTTEKNIEKFAKIMANNNVKAEVKAEVKEESSVEAVDQTIETETEQNLTVIDNDELAIADENAQIEEEMQMVLDMLQQLTQMTEGQKVQGTSNQQFTELKTKLQEVVQMLEQSLEVSMISQAGELNKLISSVKNDLTKLVEQLEIVPEYELDSKQTEQLIGQLSEKVNQAETQIKQEYQMLQQAAKPKNDSEIPTLPLMQAVKLESKESLPNNDVKVVETTDEIQLTQKTDSDKAPDSKDNEDSEESTYKGNEQADVKQTNSGDKLNQDGLKEVVAPHIEKDNFQLNIKQANANLQKESLVKFSKSDILNQVIKKADILVQGSHQEMVMKLEPESLGKLNLKIVVENGLITAKFVAESQQVKEVLESNFNQLKNALQEKGIAVQGFSVSVGQQGAEFNSGQRFEQWKQKIKLSNKMSGEYMGLDEVDSISVNPYSYHDGKVDYRA